MSKQSKIAEPTVLITLTRFGVSKITIPYRTLAEEAAGQALQQKCSAIIDLLSKVARGAAQPIEPLASKLPIALPNEKPVTHATGQPHHPRQ